MITTAAMDAVPSIPASKPAVTAAKVTNAAVAARDDIERPAPRKTVAKRRTAARPASTTRTAPATAQGTVKIYDAEGKTINPNE
jgi:hypothetical protein